MKITIFGFEIFLGISIGGHLLGIQMLDSDTPRHLISLYYVEKCWFIDILFMRWVVE